MSRFVSWLSVYDQRAFYLVNQHIRCRILDKLLPFVTRLGGATFTIALMLAMLLLSQDLIRIWSIQGLISLGASHIVVHVIKKLYGRARPYDCLAGVTLNANPLKDYSFPSGHTTAVFSIVTVFILHIPFLAIFLLPLAILVALSRMYLGLHYPTDCIIGACIGIVSSVFVVWAFPIFF
ncbi:phosphatase PAP2 family protein [Desulfuribacillus alkaliarsenatis]|uniref:Phosphatidic acid phosphatase type 2/haloperoxidase domain-containing protein n=1 Tax=Desulfuribacillus alkaliarsenatis TaxID=766136 RepID=A0A1E5G1Y8_9FIRM|nr:phosphatase PAP2 family protein [Desulfuribacillus alkaliarsenatis]OEF97000.1 hypothetical protein BHF68_05205 [Desulfuribacillus alkaliarsenatis]